MLRRSVGSGNDDAAVGNEEGQKALQDDRRAEIGMLNFVEAEKPESEEEVGVRVKVAGG